MFGSHLSIAGSMSNALREAESLGFDTVQVFTKNQQQWKAKPLERGIIDEWRSEQARLGWNGRTVSHASYLINLASHHTELWQKSLDLMTDEVERCEVLGISFVVHHPGSFTDATLERGLANISRAYHEILKRTKGYATVMCLESTAGSGSTIGGSFDELARLRAMILGETAAPARVGFCLDTCHMHAFGYNLSTKAGGEKAIAEFDRLCGLSHLRVMHFNDSKGTVGSKLDRHQHIGEGEIGRGGLASSGFAPFVQCPAVKNVPKILETPKEKNEAGIPWDKVNVDRLRTLAGETATKPRGKSMSVREPTQTSGPTPSSGPVPRGPKKPTPSSGSRPGAKKTGKHKQ